MLRLVNRVSAKLGDTSLHGRFVLLLGTCRSAIRRKPGNASATGQRNISAITTKHPETCRIRTPRRDPAAIGANSVGGSIRPASYDLLFERFLLADGAAWN